METIKLKKDIVALLRKNARISVVEMADRLCCSAEHIATMIKELEDDRVILGYSAIIADQADAQEVRAIIEVQVQPERDTGFDLIARRLGKFPEVVAVHLVSGRYDLRLEVVGQSLQDVAAFVAGKLSSQDGVKSTATLFLLKKYKEAGIEFDKEEKYERLKIVP